MRFRFARTLVITLACVLAFAANAGASVKIQKDFLAKYPEAAKYKVKCLVCHTSAKATKTDPMLNLYGTDLKAATNKFADLEAKDSDKDGVTNLDEIKAATNPGDAKDKPGEIKAKAGRTVKTVRTDAATEGKTSKK